MLVASVDKKGKLMRTIECVPVYLKQQLEQDSQSMIRYCEEQLGLKEPRILIDKIKKDTLFKVDGFYMHLSARTGKRLTFKNANQLCLDEDEMALVKKLGKYRERSRKEKNAVFSVHDGVNEQGLMSLYDTLIKKLSDTVYGKRLSAQIGTLTEGRVKFKELSLEEQALVLLQILNLFRCNNENADLKAIGGPAEQEFWE